MTSKQKKKARSVEGWVSERAFKCKLFYAHPIFVRKRPKYVRVRITELPKKNR